MSRGRNGRLKPGRKKRKRRAMERTHASPDVSAIPAGHWRTRTRICRKDMPEAPVRRRRQLLGVDIP